MNKDFLETMYWKHGHKIMKQKEQIKQLEQERDELKAHCDHIRRIAKVLYDGYVVHGNVDRLLRQPPTQSLNEIKAQAIEEAIETVTCGREYG